MNTIRMNVRQPEPGQYQVGLLRQELIERLRRAIREDGTIEPMEGLRFNRMSMPTDPLHAVSRPSFCVIAQGSKEVLLGHKRYRYDPEHFLTATAELPVSGHVTEASPGKPYLSVRLDLDPKLVNSVIAETGEPSLRGRGRVTAIDVSPLDAGLLDATARLVRLLDAPGQATFLASLITREIVYRLLVGDQGDRLRYIAVLGGTSQRIVRAIEWLHRNFDKPLRIEDLARDLGMSVSSFHHHFKAVTAMSPLQFQKQLRLQEARRLLLGEDLDATSAGFRVGYDDAAHFNREYKRLFGAPPKRDAARLREAVLASPGP